MFKLIILTEGNVQTGFGHVMRCLSLYQAFNALGILAKFIVFGDGTVKHALEGVDHDFINWVESPHLIDYYLTTAKVAIIDSYIAQLSTYEAIANRVPLVVFLDDYKRLNYPRGIVLNASADASCLSYPEHIGFQYMLGVSYALLRKEFWSVTEKQVNQVIENVMVTVGGEDSQNITPCLLRCLVDHFPHLNKKVVIGKGFNNVEDIEGAADSNTTLIFNSDARMMKNLIIDSDIAICGGGQTIYELAVCGTPAIVVALAKNQVNNIAGLLKLGFIDYAGWYNDKDYLMNITYCIQRLRDYRVRLEKSRLGRSLIDGRGPLRVAEYINTLVNN